MKWETSAYPWFEETYAANIYPGAQVQLLDQEQQVTDCTHTPPVPQQAEWLTFT